MTQARQTVGQSPYRAFITREPFLFYEMRTTARLLAEGMTEDEAIERITRENLFQYPTERSLRGMARACVRRLRTLDSAALVEAIACQPQDVARQVCLYAMMREHRLVLDFMCGVIGEKYRQRDLTYSRVDLNVFFLRLQEPGRRRGFLERHHRDQAQTDPHAHPCRKRISAVTPGRSSSTRASQRRSRARHASERRRSAVSRL